MSSDETTKIEPTLTLKDAPSIAAETPAEPKAEAPKIEAEKIEPPAVEAAAPEFPKIETPKVEPKIEAAKPELSTADVLPPAPQIEPFIAVKKPAPAAPKAPRSGRFALLAASVAIAASFGALGGSLGVAKFGPMITAAPPAPSAAKEHLADEVKALKESVAQLRAATKSLSDNFAALKTTVANTGAQNGKIAETLERIEKAQTESRKAAAAPATPETTGSIAKKEATAVPMVLGEPPTTLKPPVVSGWTLRRVYDGAALLEGRDGVIEVEAGMVVPGLGRVESIKRQDGRWAVVTARGVILGR